METRANYVAIGAFVVATIFLAFIFIYWLGSNADSSQRANVRVIFPGPVTGLSVGGLVLFNGIKIGDVAQISFDDKDPKKVIAVARLDPTTPLRKDTKATLGVSILSGVAYIELTGGSPGAADLLEGDDTPTIIADASAFEDLVEGAQDLMIKADRILTEFEKTIDVNEPSINRTVANIEKFTEALAANSDGVGQFMSGVGDAAKAFTGLSGRIGSLVEKAETIVSAVDPKKVDQAINNVVGFTDELEKSSKSINILVDNASNTAKEIDEFATGLNRTLADFDAMIEGIDPKAIQNTVNNVETFTQTFADKSPQIRETIDNVDKIAKNVTAITDTVSAQKQQIADLIKDASETAKGLNKAVAQVEAFVQVLDAQKFNSLVENANEVAATIAARKDDIASTLENARTASANIGKFTQSLSGYQPKIDQIISEAGQMTNRLNGASERVNGILAKVDGMVSADGKGLITEATKAAQSISKIAATFEKQAGPIADGLARFTGRGLQDLTGLITDARQTLSQLNRAISSFDRNPSRVIFGGSDVPTYSGNRR
ncbi:MAG: MlaD family protein [Stappiaceae bacterium]